MTPSCPQESCVYSYGCQPDGKKPVHAQGFLHQILSAAPASQEVMVHRQTQRQDTCLSAAEDWGNLLSFITQTQCLKYQQQPFLEVQLRCETQGHTIPPAKHVSEIEPKLSMHIATIALHYRFHASTNTAGTLPCSASKKL